MHFDANPGPLLRGLACLVLCAAAARAQDLEPRRWTTFPVGMNVLGIALVESQGDLSFDPVLMLTDAEVESRQQIASLVHSFGVLGKTARVDVQVPYEQARWQGKVSGTPDSVRRTGFGDPRIRLSVNLMGAPALEGKEYKEYHEARPVNTVVGAAVAVRLPWGEYHEDKLLNLGQNRYRIRPQLGVLHTRGPWSYELTGSVFLFSDNNEFFGNTEREQDPLYALQAHVVRTFPSGWWASLGAAYGWGGESTVNGDEKSDRRGDLLAGASFGFPVAPNQGVQFGYVRRRTQKDLGADTDSVFAGWSVRF
jgi:hypothetical protein